VLVFLRGHRELLPGAQEEFPVQSAKPNETVEVSAEIGTPSAPGRYTAFFRLADSERNMFGPRMWVDLIVSATDIAQDSGKSPKITKSSAKDDIKALKVVAKEVKKELKQVAKDSKLAFTLAKKEIRAKQTPAEQTTEDKEDDFYDSGDVESPGEAQSSTEVVQDGIAKESTAKQFMSRWPIQQTALRSMGFHNEELNENLLNTHQGNVQLACNELLEKMR